MIPDSQRRFLIARMSAIGDTILTLPVANALRARYPRAFIAWVVERTASPMVMGHPAVDQTIVLERGWFAKPQQILAARRLLRALEVDTSIDCQSITKTALACWLSGARTRIGCRGQYGCELSPWLNNTLVEPLQPHLTDRSLELLQPLDVHDPEVEWRLRIPTEAEESAERMLAAIGVTTSFAVINPGATWDSKLWEMDRFAAVTHYLAAQYGLPTLIVWGGQREQAWAEQIRQQAHATTRVAPRTSLLELAALMRRARIFLSADTGPLHMAVAVGTPVVGIYGATRIADCGPYGPPHVALQVQFHAGSRRERRNADNAAMRLVTVEMVEDACDRLLRRPALFQPRVA